jgi:aconitase B
MQLSQLTAISPIDGRYFDKPEVLSAIFSEFGLIKYTTFLLGTMMGGYNITPLIELLDIDATAQTACDALSKTLLNYEAYRGRSGRDQASVAGDKSSVLISPSTRKTVSLILSGSALLLVNQSAFAQALTTCLAKVLVADFSIIV